MQLIIQFFAIILNSKSILVNKRKKRFAFVKMNLVSRILLHTRHQRHKHPDHDRDKHL